MTIAELQNILQSNKQLSINKIKQIIYELKNDMVQFKKDPYEAGWNNGSMNAFYICLDLLDKVDDRLESMGLRRRFDVLADTIGLERTADPREILDTTIKKIKELKEADK